MLYFCYMKKKDLPFSLFRSGQEYSLQEDISLLPGLSRQYAVMDAGKQIICRMIYREGMIKRLSRQRISRTLLPFRYELYTPDRQKLYTIERRGGMVMYDTEIRDSKKKLLAIIQQKSLFLRPCFEIRTAEKELVGQLEGGQSDGHYRVKGADGKVLGEMYTRKTPWYRRMITRDIPYIFQISRTCPVSLQEVVSLCLLFSGMLKRETRISVKL